jgi:uncharacterized protein (DUF2267 family)
MPLVHPRGLSTVNLIADVADHLGLPIDQGFRVVTAVFTALRDRIPDEEVVAGA